MPAIYRNLQSKCIENIQFAFMCTICIRVQICTRMQINLHHLEGRSNFATGCKFLKHRSHGQKYTPGADANLHPGANKFAPPRRQEQICTRVQTQILKTPFTWPKIHTGCKFAPRVQICTRVQIAHMNQTS